MGSENGEENARKRLKNAIFGVFEKLYSPTTLALQRFIEEFFTLLNKRRDKGVRFSTVSNVAGSNRRKSPLCYKRKYFYSFRELERAHDFKITLLHLEF